VLAVFMVKAHHKVVVFGTTEEMWAGFFFFLLASCSLKKKSVNYERKYQKIHISFHGCDKIFRADTENVSIHNLHSYCEGFLTLGTLVLSNMLTRHLPMAEEATRSCFTFGSFR
jgi:hypothetical protein